jgi:hypothetical protein
VGGGSPLVECYPKSFEYNQPLEYSEFMARILPVWDTGRPRITRRLHHLDVNYGNRFIIDNQVLSAMGGALSQQYSVAATAGQKVGLSLPHWVVDLLEMGSKAFNTMLYYTSRQKLSP